jgi:hypothetical protein
MTLKKTLSKLTKNNKIHKEGFEAGYDKGVKEERLRIKEKIKGMKNKLEGHRGYTAWGTGYMEALDDILKTLEE